MKKEEFNQLVVDMCKDFKCCTACDSFGGYEINGKLINAHCLRNVNCTTCYVANTVAKVLISAWYSKEPKQLKFY